MDFGNNILWTFLAECEIPADAQQLMSCDEAPICAYKTIRDSAIFTNKRLIVRDAQGIKGKKVEMYSLPYRSIDMWSSENAGGILDFTSELEIWSRVGHIKINLGKGVDVRRLDKMIATCVLRNA